MGRNAFFVEGRTCLRGCCNMRAHDEFDGIAAEPQFSVTDKQWINVLAAALDQPPAQDLDTVLADWGRTFFASLAYAAYMRTRTENDIAAGQVDRLRDAQSGLQHERQQGSIPAAMPR